MTRIIHGESLEHLSVMMEKMVERYDKFIKDLHLSIIKYVENMYNKVTGMMSSYWKRLLHNIEPSIIKFAHYVETMMWNISKEVFGENFVCPYLINLLFAFISIFVSKTIRKIG